MPSVDQISSTNNEVTDYKNLKRTTIISSFNNRKLKNKKTPTTALKRVDFPTFGRPTMPAFKLILILLLSEIRLDGARKTKSSFRRGIP